MSAGIESALLGDALASAVAVDHSQFDLQNSLVSVEQQNISDTSSVRQELIFVDAATPEYQQLVQQLIAGAGDGRDFDVIIIDSGSDGITQISQVLIGYDSLDAIHVISHGADGGVQLGNAWLDGGSLARYADLIAGWGDALDADADLLFYGCDLAAGTDGQDLIAELATLTGADIAASNDLTGHTELGGDWVLEYQSGAVESSIVADSVTQKAWRGVLSNISGTIFEDVDGNANLGDAVGVANVSMILYLDDGDGIIDAGDSLVTSTLTNGAGLYDFTGLSDATYWVVVDSTSIAPTDGFNGGFNIGDVWAEQTWGSAGAVSFDGAYNYLGVSGAFYGGMQGEVSDDASALTSAEHVTRVVLAGVDVTNVDSAFSFNAITRTGDGDDDLGANRSMQGSLRQFIQNSNALVGIQTSDFSISTTDSNYNLTGNGEYTIQVGAGGYAAFTDTVILNATTQEGYSGDPLIELDGTNASGSTAGLVLRTNDSTIRGFIVHSFPDDGIEIVGNTGFGANNTVQNNWVGIDATGVAAGNADDGIIVAFAAAGNQIGGTGLNDGNVVAGNLGSGIVFRNVGSDNNIVEANYIGVGSDGVTAIGNQEHGINIFAGASSNRVGGAGAGNVISGNAQNGVDLWGATTTLNIVIGNYIGTDYTGTVAVGNIRDGIHIGGGASNNVFGGTGPGEGNIISGNLDDGIEILLAGTSNNAVIGNYIGTDVTGAAPLGNGRHGVVIYDGANNTTIGGSLAGAGNVISANGDDGIVIDGNWGVTTVNNVIVGNFIGTDAGGANALGNAENGIWLHQNAIDNTIGGAAPGEGNVISGNAFAGIAMSFADNLNILGNFIGTAADGVSALGNGRDGIWIGNSDFVNIGDPGAGNVIAANGHSGIQAGSAVLTQIQANWIGTDQSGTVALGNSQDGIELWSVALSTMIGGTVAGQGNVIAYNDDYGVSMRETVGTGNSILGNSIHSNGLLGIELTENGPVFGVTPNDPLDADTAGANDLQNYPLLISANTDEIGNVYIAGAMHAAAGTAYRVEFFANTAQDGSGHGEGETYLGFVDVTTDGTGSVSFSTVFGATVAAGSFITTTATAPDGSTSEFSADVVSLDMGKLVVDISSDDVNGDVSSIAALLADRGIDERISLREAILATNVTANTGGPDEIHFNLQLDDPNHFYYQNDFTAGSLSLVTNTTADDADILDFDPDYPVMAHSWYRIQPTSPLTITDTVIIDGYTQSGATPNTLGIGTDAILKIEINGDLSGNTNAFVVNASSTELRGLVINGDFNIAIAVNASDVNVSGNYIGTDITGTQAGTNLDIGLYISTGAFDNIIGGATAADRNVISGTTSNAVWILSPTTQGNTIRGNYIGTNALGDAAMANASSGIVLTGGTHNNTIQDNVISGNTTGILLDGNISAPDSNTIIGNLIGTDATGTLILANAVGIWLQNGVTNTMIGGTNASQRNVVSGNTNDGIRVHDAGTTGNTILGNFIGTDLSGTVALGNGQAGISISNNASGNTVGGTTPGAGNIVSGNSSGISITNSASANVVQGNFIGLDVTGTNALGNNLGVYITTGANNNTVGGTAGGAGNVVSGNTDGIYISDAGTTGNTVQGNAIGTDAGGTIDVGNSDDGIEIINGASGNLIGGTAVGARNVISGNDGDGVSIRGAGTMANLVHGNYIGTDSSGSAALGNGVGIRIQLGATNNQIGGTVAGAGNVISGNTSHGVAIANAGTTGNTVEGNYIGTNAAGDAAIANGFQGVLINQAATGNIVGGTAPGARNVISGNLSTGVYIQNAGTSGNLVQGNYIGTNAAGDAAIGNSSGGVRVSDFATDNTIGGAAAGAGNLISGNSWGVQIFTNAFDNFVQGNLIGTDWTGTAALANTGVGVTIQTGANGNTIGGTLAGEGNVIAYNSSSGVQITTDSGSGNSILGNSIHTNSGLGIEVMPWGVDANIIALSSAVTDGASTITIGGTVTGAPASTTYRVELFANVAGDPSGSGEGEIYLGFVDVVTDVSGNATFSVPLAAVVPPGYMISATATAPLDNTTEFAGNIVAISLPPVIDLDLDNSSGETGADFTTGFIEDGGPVLIADDDGTLTDPDTLQWMTVTITNPLDGVSELLAADITGTNIVAVYDPLTGILNLSGADTAAHYQQVLRTVTYNNSSDDPTLTTRIIEFIANDGGSSSNLATTTLTISAVNDAPVLGGANNLTAIGEDPISNSGTLVSDLLAGHFSDVDGGVSGIAVFAVDNTNGTWQYSTDGGSSWLDFGAVDTSSARLLAADANTYARFVPDPDWNGTVVNGISFYAWDQTTGTAGGTANLTGLESVRDEFNVVNYGNNNGTQNWTSNWAEFSDDGSPATGNISITGGGLYLDNQDGGSLESVSRQLDLSGATSATFSFDYSGYAFSGTDSFAIAVSNDGGTTWLQLEEIVFVDDPGTNFSGSRSFDLASYLSLTSDMVIRFEITSGLAGPGQHVAFDNVEVSYDSSGATGGATAFSASTTSSSITVNAANDAPVLTPATPSLPTINEDDINNSGILISTLLGASVSDIDSGSLLGIAVTDLSSGNGTWEYSTDGGVSWIAVGTVTDASALLLRDSDSIRFVPDGANADAASFDFRAWDQTTGLFGTQVNTSPNGGTTAFSTATDTADITVSVGNDAPVLTPATPSLPTINEDDINNSGILISTLLGASVSDIDSGSLLGIAVTDLSSGNGTWEYSTDGGVSWIAVGTVTDASALLLRDSDSIRFVPDGANADAASFDFRAWDQSTGLFGTQVNTSPNGGTTAFSTATDTADITVSVGNDAPVLTPATPSLPTINEDDINNSGILISTLLGGSVTDPDSGALQGIAVTGLTSGNGTWEYSTDGGVSWIAVGTVTDASALLLRDSDHIRFVPDGANADAASFDFRAWDQTTGLFGTMADTSVNGDTTAYSTATDTADITVSAVNDAPVLTPATPSLPTINEDDINNSGILISTLLGASVSDIDSGSLLGIAVTDLSSGNGTWEYSTDGGVSWIAVGTVTDASALLLRDSDHIRFVPDGANADAASFDFRAWDQSTGLFGTQVNTSPNGGTTAFSTATDTADIIVNTVNTAPFTTGPVSISTVEDGPTTTYDLYTLFGDTDDPLTSLTFSIVSNDNTVLTTASIDNATGTLTMTQAADLSGVATLTLRATDPSGAFVDTTFTVTVDPVDDPVVNLAPAAQTVADGQFLLFSSANGNSISVSDVDSTNVTVSLSIPAGFLTLGSITGLVFSAGDGISDSQMTFTGSIADVNAALDGLLFQPLVSFGGIVSLEIATWSPDLPPADRAPIRTDVVNVMILDAVVTTESVLPGPVDNQATPAPNDSDDSEPDLEESSTDETEDQIAAEPEYAAGLSGFSDFSVANIELPEVVEPALPDSDFANTREVVSAMTRMLMELGIDGKLPAFIISDAVMDALDAMKDEMGGLDNASDQQHEFLVQLATGLTLTLSAGFVSWMMRAGALLTSLLSTTPLWQRFDPLPVLAGRRDEDEDEDEDRDAVRALFGADA